MLSLIFSLVEEAVKITPGLVTAFEEIFSRPNPSPDDWAELRAKVAAGSYADYVPKSDLNQPPLVASKADNAADPTQNGTLTPQATTPAEAVTPVVIPAPETLA